MEQSCSRTLSTGLLIAIPTGTAIVAHCFLTWYGHRMLKKLYINFDRLEQAMIGVGESLNYVSATTELRRRFFSKEGNS